MKKRFVKFLALALVLIMVLSAMPVSAIAQGFANGEDVMTVGEWLSKVKDGFNDLIRPRPTDQPTPSGKTFSAVTESGLIVEVEAPKGAFPTGTTMTVADVANMEAVQAAVDNAEGISGTVLTAVDITFKLRGREIQPKCDITVSITSDALAGVQNPTVVHIDADADELTGEDNADELEAELNANTVTFDAAKFSIYAVIGDGQQGDKARAKVIFKNVGATADDDSEIASMYIKQDDTPEELKYIVYDPGAGTIANGCMFVGWSTSRTFTTESDRMTIQDVRNWLDQQTIKEGDEFVFYAMIFTVYTVSFIGEPGEQTGINVSLGSDSVIIPTTTENAEYEIKLDYNPDGYNQHFEGWLAKDSDSLNNIVSVKVNGEEIPKTGHIPVHAVLTIKGDVELTVDAPEGFWVIYKENAKGATYIAPDFYPDGTTTVAPDKTPKRYGYDFGGWYTNQECTGSAYPFNTTLTANVTLYAKWNAHTNAPYTVIIWKQNVSGEGYDFEEIVQITSGTVGAAQTAVTSSGSGNSAVASVNGSSKSYTGFHLDHYDSDKVIRTEGDTVINVYYNRNEHTFTFRDTVTAVESYDPVDNPDWDNYASIDDYYYFVAPDGEYRGAYLFYDGYPYAQILGTGNNNDTTLNRTLDPDYADYYFVFYNNTLYQMEYTGRYWRVYYNNNWVWADSSTFSNARYLMRGDTTYPTAYLHTEGSTSSTPTVIHTVTRLYGQDISDIWDFTGTNGVTYPQESPATSWKPYDPNNSNTVRITFMQRMPDEDIIFDHNTPGYTTRYFYYWVEALPGTPENTTSTQAGERTIRYNNKVYVLWKYLPNDFQIVFYNDDFFEINGFTRLQITNSNLATVSISTTGSRWSDVSSSSYPAIQLGTGATANTLYFFYTRNSKSIIYMDGVYVDGSGNSIALPSRNELGTDDGILYGADISDRNKGGENYFVPECTDEGYEGFVFEGWYYDSACVKRATFTTIQDANIVVYAKWRQIQYRVYLQPNMHDQDLDWGDTDPTMCFRVAYNDLVELRTGRVPGKYMFLGWWMDEEMEDHPYVEDVTVLNKDIEDQFMEDYDMNTEYTDTYDRYGDLQNPKENSDLTGYDPDPEDPYNALEPRFWITKKLTLFAKWRAIYDGVDGIQVIYDAVEGENAPNDPLTYLDESDAIARAASTAPEGYVFLYWVLQTWDVAQGKFVDLDATKYYYYPGAKFTVDDADAHLYEENGVKRMEVQLRAEYGKVGAATPTHIYWYSNLKDLDQEVIDKNNFVHPSDAEFVEGKGWRMVTPEVYINIAYDIVSPTTFSVPGYKFVGWARINSETGYTGNSDYTHITEDDLFLKWVEDPSNKAEGGHYEAQNDAGAWVPVTQIAADERHSYHDLYAVWTTEYFYVFHSSNKKLEAIKMPHSLADTYDLTAMVADGYIYGGYYTTYGGVDAAVVEAAKSGARSDSQHVVTIDSAEKYDGKSLTATNGSRFWTKKNAYGQYKPEAAGIKISGDAMTPQSETVYYLKEVPNIYMGTHCRWVYYWSDNRIEKLYMLTCIDDGNFNEAGFYLASEDDREAARIVTTFSYAQNPSTTGKSITANTLIKQRGYIGVVDASEYVDDIAEGGTTGIIFVPFWVTLDGVEVTYRAVKISNSGSTDKLYADKVVWTVYALNGNDPFPADEPENP
ncbi:MAG: InlB B-repeat-containing protein [Clostridia bacterium]|nr:InlB B-repeat-containing protein [Clostridia bacterium]